MLYFEVARRTAPGETGQSRTSGASANRGR